MQTDGLRERKRAQTFRGIHDVAAELVLEHGLDGATVEEISERCDVSRRTFFNYFASKEDAVLGIDWTALDDPDDSDVPRTGDLIEDTAELVWSRLERGFGDDVERARRKRILEAHPQLVTRMMSHMGRLEEQLAAIVAGWLIEDRRFAADSPAERSAAATALVSVGFAMMRTAIRAWPSETDADPRTRYLAATAALRDLLERVR